MLSVSDQSATIAAIRSEGQRRLSVAASPHEVLVKSATRALEIIELFSVYREALSVSDVAFALNIPQSSSSILLQAMNKAGFIDRDRQTRKYVPSLRSTFLGDCMLRTAARQPDLSGQLDELSSETGCSIRLAVRSGIYAQYAHIAWPSGHSDRLRLRPGHLVPICDDALGAVLLAQEEDETILAIIRHANAVRADQTPPVNARSFIEQLATFRRCGVMEGPSFDTPSETILALRISTYPQVSAALGIAVPNERLPGGRPAILKKLATLAATADRRVRGSA